MKDDPWLRELFENKTLTKEERQRYLWWKIFGEYLLHHYPEDFKKFYPTNKLSKKRAYRLWRKFERDVIKPASTFR